MARERNTRWTEVIPEEHLPSLQWFYEELLPALILAEPPFWHPDHEQLFKDWQYQPWLHYYDDFPWGYFQLVCLALGLPEAKSTSGPSDPVRFALEIVKTLHEKADAIESGAALSREVQDFASPRLLPLKLAQFVLLNQVACFLLHKSSIAVLMKEARTGDTESMMKLVSIDHIFLEHDVIRDQVRLATLFGKTAFLKSLGKAIASRPAYGDPWKFRDDFFIFLTWHLGFESTGVEQFGFFLNACGMKRFSSTSSLQRKLNRLGISTK